MNGVRCGVRRWRRTIGESEGREKSVESPAESLAMEDRGTSGGSCEEICSCGSFDCSVARVGAGDGKIFSVQGENKSREGEEAGRKSPPLEIILRGEAEGPEESIN